MLGGAVAGGRRAARARRSAPRGHGELILLDDRGAARRGAQLSLRELDAIAFGRGREPSPACASPSAVAQGLGFAAGLPLLPISDLRAVAAQALAAPGAARRSSRVLVCQDARMGEVYWGCFESRAAEPMPLGERGGRRPRGSRVCRRPGRGEAVRGAGSGFEAHCEPALEALTAQLSARAGRSCARRRARLRRLASREDVPRRRCARMQAQPVYLRDQVADGAVAAKLTQCDAGPETLAVRHTAAMCGTLRCARARLGKT